MEAWRVFGQTDRSTENTLYYTGWQESIGPPIIQNMAYFDRFMQKL